MRVSEIIAALVGFILGGIVMIIAIAKYVEDIWETAYKAGEQFGMVTEIIRQVNERKEAELFGKVSGDAAD